MNIEELKQLKAKAEKSLRYAINKIDALEKALEDKEEWLPEYGQLCYFWDFDRPKFPMVRPFHSKRGVIFYSFDLYGGVGASWKYCEPIIIINTKAHSQLEEV